jgi:hypothetical protein
MTSQHFVFPPLQTLSYNTGDRACANTCAGAATSPAPEATANAATLSPIASPIPTQPAPKASTGCNVTLLTLPDGNTTEIPHRHGEPDFNWALVIIAHHYGVPEDEMDAGEERPCRRIPGRSAFHVYHPAHGLLATVSYPPTGALPLFSTTTPCGL